MISRRALSAFSCLTVAIVVGGGTPANCASAQTMHLSPHQEETANIVGLKGALVASFSKETRAQGGSLIPFYERNLIDGWLEIEGAVAFTFLETERVIGFDLFLKKPFHVSTLINPYIAIGPNISILREEARGEEETQTRTRFGLLASVGTYIWFAQGQWGFDVEVVYLALFDDHITHELALEVGPAFRF